MDEYISRQFLDYQNKALNTSTSNIRDSSIIFQKPENFTQLLIDNATRLECAKCLELFVPNEFYEHLTGENSCKGVMWKKGNKSVNKLQQSETASPIIKNKSTVRLNKENNLEDINPLSERGSYSSLYQAKKITQNKSKMVLPPQAQKSKERTFGNEMDSNHMNTDHTRQSVNQSYRIPYNDCSCEVHHSNAFNQYGLLHDYSNYPGTCKNNTCKNKDMCNLRSSMGFGQVAMTPANHCVHESFIIQPHCNRNSVMHSQWGITTNDCCGNKNQNLSSIDNFSHIYGPSIEDRLENTEKLIREMNAKFEDITSNKFSAKQEFNKLVQTLTMTSDRINYNDESDSNDENEKDLSSTEEQCIHSYEEKDSDNSSFDEETSNMNQQNLKQILKCVEKNQNNIKENNSKQLNKSKVINQYMKNSSSNIMSSSKLQEKTGFSNSRYENLDNDGLDEEMIQYSDDHKNYLIPESKFEYDNYIANNSKESDSDFGDKLYQNAKSNLARTKILLMSSQQDYQYVDDTQHEDNNDIQLLNLSSKRVKNILRNKHKRMMEKQENKSKGGLQFAKEESLNDSESFKMPESSENDPEEYLHHNQNGLIKNTSRNHEYNVPTQFKSEYDPNRFIHQTTSSGNMVLYDSVLRASSQSPQEIYDQNFIDAINQQHLKVYETQDERNYENNLIEDEYEIDILQNQRVADEEYAHYYHQQESDEDNMADYDEDYDEEEETDEVSNGMKNMNKYINQKSNSKFKY